MIDRERYFRQIHAAPHCKSTLHALLASALVQATLVEEPATTDSASRCDGGGTHVILVLRGAGRVLELCFMRLLALDALGVVVPVHTRHEFMSS